MTREVISEAHVPADPARESVPQAPLPDGPQLFIAGYASNVKVTSRIPDFYGGHSRLGDSAATPCGNRLGRIDLTPDVSFVRRGRGRLVRHMIRPMTLCDDLRRGAFTGPHKLG